MADENNLHDAALGENDESKTFSSTGQSAWPADYQQADGQHGDYQPASYQQAPANDVPADYQRPAATPYVRQRPAHRTVEPINDYANDEQPDSYFAHDSDFTTRGNVVSGNSYRSSRRESEQLRRDLHYGQYLEVPKGRRDIFVSREKRTRNRTIIALIAVLIVLAIALYLVWDVLSGTWFAIS